MGLYWRQQVCSCINFACFCLFCGTLESDSESFREMFTLNVVLKSSICTCQYGFCSLFLTILDLHVKNHLNVFCD